MTMDTLKSAKEQFQAVQAKIEAARKNYTTHPTDFNDEAEVQKFRIDHQPLLDESVKLQEKIWQLEYDAMTPEEQQKQMETEQKVKAKLSRHNPRNP